MSSRLRFRVNYLLSHSEQLIVLDPEVTDTLHAFVLKGDGSARLKQLEVTAAASAYKEDQLFVSYVHSYSVGNLNEFSTYLADFPPAVILPDARTFLPGDTPNRFLAWGTFAFPYKFRIMPKVEYRTGFPWSPAQRLPAIRRRAQSGPFSQRFFGRRPHQQRLQSDR